MDLKTARLWVKTKAFQYKLERTKRFIAESLSKVEGPYVACSFGKDSSVMLHLVLEQSPDIDVVFVARPETNLVDNYQEVVSAWGDINLVTICFEQDTFQFINKSVIKTAMATIVDQYDSYFIGLRAYGEAVGRRITLKKDGDFYKMANGLTRICPVAWWSTAEIAAYCLAFGLPILNKYLVDGFEARTTAGVSSKMPQESLEYVKRTNINAYNELLKMLPDAKYFS